jgi:hypothetical protein
VKFSQATEETFYDIELFNAVSTAIKGKNFYVLQYFQKEHILKQIQRQFPFVIDMQFQMEAKPIITGEEVAISQDETVVGTGSETIETDGSVQIDTGGKVESLAVLAALEPIKGGILGVDLKFKDPVLKVKLGGKEF